MKKIYALVLLVIVVASCKKDDPGLTVEQRLIAATNGWVFESIIGINPTTGQQEDFTKNPAAFDQCDLDDAVIFAEGQTYTVATNTKCDPGDPAINDSGTWILSSDKATIAVISTTDGPIITLTKMTVDDTNIKGETSSFGGFPIVAQVTMKKK